MKAEYDVEVEWQAFELHPEIPPEGMPLSAYIHTRFDAMSRRLKQMAGEVGLDMVTIEIIPNSRRALEAAEYARQQGQHEVFLSLIHISEPTRLVHSSRMPSSA